MYGFHRFLMIILFPHHHRSRKHHRKQKITGLPDTGPLGTKVGNDSVGFESYSCQKVATVVLSSSVDFLGSQGVEQKLFVHALDNR